MTAMLSGHRPNRVLGGPHDTFWKHCSDDELRMQYCPACNAWTWPPRPDCELCGASALQWLPMTGQGRIVGWCTFEQRYYPDLPVPWDTILVELEEGPLLISNPLDLEPLEHLWQLPVKVAFIDCDDQAGPFRLPVFTRAEPEGQSRKNRDQ